MPFLAISPNFAAPLGSLIGQKTETILLHFSFMTHMQGSQYVRMYGFFFGNSQKCTELGIRTSVHDDFNPCTDKCKSVHGNPYIRTFYGDYCIKMAFFLPFFRIFFCFLPIFSKFSRFAQIYNIYSMISNEFLII